LNIRFTSSLTPEDENTLAPALLRAISSLLDVLPIAYVLRIDTSDSHVYQQSNASDVQVGAAEAPPRSVLQPAVDSDYL